MVLVGNDTDPDSGSSQFIIRIRIQGNDSDSTDPDPPYWRSDYILFSLSGFLGALLHEAIRNVGKAAGPEKLSELSCNWSHEVHERQLSWPDSRLSQQLDPSGQLFFNSSFWPELTAVRHSSLTRVDSCSSTAAFWPDQTAVSQQQLGLSGQPYVNSSLAWSDSRTSTEA